MFVPKLDKSVPTLLLGGGGYNNQLTARLWTTLTAVALRAPALGPDIPTEDQVPKYVSQKICYGPDHGSNFQTISPWLHS